MTKADGPNHLPVGEKRKTAKPFNVSFARAVAKTLARMVVSWSLSA
jgi:hypothetical protein